MKYEFKSFAKINHFLNILDKRKDGYHNIQSIFQLINLFDVITFEQRSDNIINLNCNIENLKQNNSILDAINIFKKEYKIKKLGLDIYLKKNIPIGGGLGGGSSNAAVTLKALTEIWKIKENNYLLSNLALKLGSDVPFFLNGKNAWVEGRGEIITNVDLKPYWFILIFSQHSVSTTQIYENLMSSRKYQRYDYDDFLDNKIGNDFKDIVLQKYPSIRKSYELISKFANINLTGTGGTLFIKFDTLEEAEKTMLKIPNNQNPKIIESY